MTLLASACRERLVEIDFGGLPFGVVLLAYASPDTIAAGGETTIVLILENTNDHEVDLHLPSKCGLVWWIEDTGGDRVFPEQGGECSPSDKIGSLVGADPSGTWHLLPNQSFDWRWKWTAVRAVPGGLQPLEPGTYHLIGSVGRDTGVRAGPFGITVR